MKATEMVDKIKDLLGIELTSQEAEAVKLAQSTLENGTVIEYDSMEAGSPVFIVSEDEKIALPAGEYTLEDGKILVVVDEGEIAEIKEAAEEEVDATEEVEAAQEEEEEVTAEYIEREEFDALKKQIEDLKREFEKHYDEKEEMAKKEKEELSKVEVDAEPVYHSPDATQETKMNISTASNYRQETTLDRVLKKLYN